MSNNKKIKEHKLISKYNNFNPTYIKFNFSFINYEKDFKDEYKLQLLKRIRQLSNTTYLEVMSWPKNIGIEIEKIDIDKKIDEKFFDSATHRNFDDKKYAVFRLYSNNNPIVARVIGRVINNIFYIFFIDIGGNLYKH